VSRIARDDNLPVLMPAARPLSVSGSHRCLIVLGLVCLFAAQQQVQSPRGGDRAEPCDPDGRPSLHPYAAAANRGSREQLYYRAVRTDIPHFPARVVVTSDRTLCIVLEELSGARNRLMIGSMATTARPQQRYDHRLRDLVQRTGDVTVATDLGVPRSTARGWLGAGPTIVVGLDVAHLTNRSSDKRF
jgi:hypothetical protein